MNHSSIWKTNVLLVGCQLPGTNRGVVLVCKNPRRPDQQERKGSSKGDCLFVYVTRYGKYLVSQIGHLPREICHICSSDHVGKPGDTLVNLGTVIPDGVIRDPGGHLEAGKKSLVSIQTLDTTANLRLLVHPWGSCSMVLGRHQHPIWILCCDMSSIMSRGDGKSRKEKKK